MRTIVGTGLTWVGKDGVAHALPAVEWELNTAGNDSNVAAVPTTYATRGFKATFVLATGRRMLARNARRAGIPVPSGRGAAGRRHRRELKKRRKA